MKNSEKFEGKIYHILGTIFSCISSCYFMLQYAFHGVEGIVGNIREFTTISILFGAVMAVTSVVLYLRKSLSNW